MKVYWTEEEVVQFREWHEARLAELNYPKEMADKLRKDRKRWMPRPKKEKA